jgi:hypothetical protein
VNYYGLLKINISDPNTIHEANSSVCKYQQDYLSIFLRVNVANVWWLGTSGGVVVIRTDKYSYGHTCHLIRLLQLLYGKLALRLNNVAVDAECLGDLRL